MYHVYRDGQDGLEERDASSNLKHAMAMAVELSHSDDCEWVVLDGSGEEVIRFTSFKDEHDDSKHECLNHIQVRRRNRRLRGEGTVRDAIQRRWREVMGITENA